MGNRKTSSGVTWRMRRTILRLLLGLFLAFVLGYVIVGRDYVFAYAWQMSFRLTNLSGKEVSVTSNHTHDTTRIRPGATKRIPHGGGSIIIEQSGGAVWVYPNLRPSDLAKTPYLVIRKSPLPFAAGSMTASLALSPDGRVFAATSGTTEGEFCSIEQPPGFPLQPSTDQH